LKKYFKVIGIGFLALALSFGASALPAAADPGCVTQAEFKKIKNGMTKKRVAKIFGTPGEVFSAAGKGRYRVEVRNYEACSEFGAVSVGFIANKVESKTGFFY
jgi:hypothetical protein